MVALAGWWACALAWMRSVDWVYRDATRLTLAPAFWSTVTALPFVVTALVVWWIPSTIACFVLLGLAWLVPLGAYVSRRNRTLPRARQVCTPAHGRRILADLLQPFGIDLAPGGDEDDTSLLPAVELLAVGGTDATEDAARQEKASALPGFTAAVKLLQEAVLARADALVIEPAPEGMEVRHQVDGVWQKKRTRVPPKRRKDRERWQEAAATSREEGLAIVQALQALCGLAGTKPQTGRCAVRVDGKPRQCRLGVQPLTEGPRLSLQIEPPATAFTMLTDTGMPEPLAEAVGAMLALEKGLFIIAGPAGSGLTTTFDLVVQTGDRLMRDFISLEDAAAPPRAIQNVRPVRFDARTGTTPTAALAAALREYPNVIVTRDIRDKSLLGELVKLAAESQFVIISLAAADAGEAAARVAAAGVPKDLLARTCVGVLAQRLVRRVCPKCREDHPPPPELLRRLGQTAEQVPTIHRAAAEGCRLCQGTGYLGRTAVFELAAGSALRPVIAAGEPPSALRAAAVKGGMRPLAAAGLTLVATGVTSLEEVQRALAPPPATTKPRREART